MTPAPTLKGYVCRMCGNETIETPWADTDGFHCSQEKGGCGATNKTPLVPKATFMDPLDMKAGTVTAQDFAKIFNLRSNP
jgi:hypothetical protein